MLRFGIFDGNYCVGAATIGTDQIMGGSISIPTSSIDEGSSGIVNGFTTGHPVTLQLYRTGQTYPLVPTKVGGTESFEKNGSIFVTVTASGLPSALITRGPDQLKCFPNPFSDQLTVEIRIQDPKELEVSVYDLNGKLIRILYKGQAVKLQSMVWDGRSGSGAKVVPGTYLLKANWRIEKIVLRK